MKTVMRHGARHGARLTWLFATFPAHFSALFRGCRRVTDSGLCGVCGVRDRAPGKRQCSGCRYARRRDSLPCSGGCGGYVTGGGVRLDPTAPRVCHPCRRARRALRWTPSPIACAHPACQATIEHPRHSRQRFCSRRCSQREYEGRPQAQARYVRRRARRAGAGALGRPWKVLRARVLAEESVCWICEDDIDQDLPGTHPMGGTGDHVIPLEDGGAALDRENVRAAHRTCNVRRHHELRRARRRALREAA
jgi:5-methylcytosine-specific restriction endonuclease McrA